ncbi:LysR family transcriptional regulator [Allostella sp. ATCC 35155]|nr:LysR family transcriptional regulator [Stella sp. ATCC 35155]
MRFDVTDLRLFVAVCRAGSISRGAARVALALPSASRRIAEMEREIARPLLVRGRDGVRPTDDGRTLLDHAERLLAQWRDMAGEMGIRPAIGRPPLRLAVNTGAVAGLLPFRLPGFLADNPEIAVDLAEMASEAVVETVTAGGADLGIGLAPAAPDPALDVWPLGPDRLVLLLPDGHPLAAAGDIQMAEAAVLPFVALPGDRPLQRYIDRQVAGSALRLAVRVRLPDIAALCRLVQAGAGAAVLPEAAVRASGVAVTARSIADRWADRRLVLVRSRHRRPIPGLERMAACLLAASSGGAGAITNP